MVSFRGSIAKAMLCTLNLAFILMAFAIILLGLQMQVQTSYMSADQQHRPSSQHYDPHQQLPPKLINCWQIACTVLILFGSLLALISVFGFGAALCESAMLLNIYVYFLCVSMCICAFSASIFLVFNGQLMSYGRYKYAQIIQAQEPSLFGSESNNRHVHDFYAYAVQNFQRTFFCCGVDSPQDWTNRTFGNQSLSLDSVPISCCGILPDLEPYKTCSRSQIIHHDGCFSVVQINRFRIFIQMMATILILFLALLLSLACCLERDRCLQLSQLVNLQYAVHLSNCRQQPLGFSGGGDRGESVMIKPAESGSVQNKAPKFHETAKNVPHHHPNNSSNSNFKHNSLVV